MVLAEPIRTPAALNEAFSANRAIGRVVLSVAAKAGQSRRARVHEAGSLRVRFPGREPSRNGAAALDAMLVNTAGGMAGGDRFDIGIAVEAGARLRVTSASAEKIYRSLAPDAEIAVKLDIGSGAELAWLPQETILFDGACLRRTIDAEVARTGALLLAEATIFGRAAMGETLVCGRLFDRWRVRVDGGLVFAETVRLDGPIAQHLAHPAIAGERAAIASVLKIPGGDEAVAAIRAMQQNFIGEVGTSAWNGLAVARLVAPDGAALRHDLINVLASWSSAPLPRLWLN